MPVRIRATPVDTRENFFYAISPLASFLIQLGLLGGKEDPHTRLPLCSYSFSEFSRSRYIYRYRYIFICRIICLSLRLWEDLIRFVFVTCNYSENRILVHNFPMECSGKGREKREKNRLEKGLRRGRAYTCQRQHRFFRGEFSRRARIVSSYFPQYRQSIR